MALSLNKVKVVFFAFLAATLVLNLKAYAFDKKASTAISHYIMGVMYEDMGDIDAAIEEYQKALKSDSASVAVHLNLASSYIKKNDNQKAIDELNLACNLDPEAVEPHAILALLYSVQNKETLAAGEYELALKNAAKLTPKNIDIYKGLGSIYISQKRLKEAEGIYRLIIGLNPNDEEAHFLLGSVYYELKDAKQAEKELNRSIELKPDYHEALNFLGYVYADENRNLSRSEAMIRKAISLSPDNGAYIDSLGWLYFRRGRLKEALVELEKASGMMEDPVIYDHLGEVYLKLKDPVKARLNWEKSLKLDPGQDKVKEKLGKVK